MIFSGGAVSIARSSESTVNPSSAEQAARKPGALVLLAMALVTLCGCGWRGSQSVDDERRVRQLAEQLVVTGYRNTSERWVRTDPVPAVRKIYVGPVTGDPTKLVSLPGITSFQSSAPQTAADDDGMRLAATAKLDNNIEVWFYKYDRSSKNAPDLGLSSSEWDAVRSGELELIGVVVGVW
ncbi:hypothetical protein [Streptoalloteichus hindustanus]|uniref:Uncharacterized protein n=1 Tax=Streptoalloteichus hindustanus TaxID=2017 RepID=A0A1M5ID57_STRHI|nr:hypothetical protein [Streptoalloteichus hindustanus]SHG26177.1 hypothetical protein SAMN05444320_107230 [Streptoalloteichus hindustanus]